MNEELNAVLAALVVLKKLQRFSNELEELATSQQAKHYTASNVPEPHLNDEQGQLLPDVKIIIQDAQKALNEVIKTHVDRVMK